MPLAVDIESMRRKNEKEKNYSQLILGITNR